MKWFLSATWTLAWALWLGGVVAVVMLVQRLFPLYMRLPAILPRLTTV